MHGFTELTKYIASETFKERHGDCYVIPKRISQDCVESFFSVQRQMCGGNSNMTAFSYGYNLNGILSYRSSNLLKGIQTSYDVCSSSIDSLAVDVLPKRTATDSVKQDTEWTLFVD